MLQNNIKFIRTPLTEIVRQGFIEAQSLEHNMLTGHIVRSLLDSVFLKVAGALEQKCQSIYWVLGNNEIDIRYKLREESFGTFSKLAEKEKILKYMPKKEFTLRFVSKIKKHLSINKNDLHNFGYLHRECKELFNWKFKKGNKDFFWGKYSSELNKIYNKAIDYRNLIAHNTLAAKKDKMQFNDMNHDILKHLFVLLIMDEIFIEAFNTYINNT
ncbi:hypothetical protein R83H12_00896 [Fibrobacteria bacterium R8-3-H12]